MEIFEDYTEQEKLKLAGFLTLQIENVLNDFVLLRILSRSNQIFELYNLAQSHLEHLEHFPAKTILAALLWLLE